MLAKVIESVIKSRQYDRADMELKLDVFWAAGKLTNDEYEHLYDLMDQYPPIGE